MAITGGSLALRDCTVNDDTATGGNGIPRKLHLAAANPLAVFANEVRALGRAGIPAADLADLWLFELENIRVTMP